MEETHVSYFFPQLVVCFFLLNSSADAVFKLFTELDSLTVFHDQIKTYLSILILKHFGFLSSLWIRRFFFFYLGTLHRFLTSFEAIFLRCEHKLARDHHKS